LSVIKAYRCPHFQIDIVRLSKAREFDLPCTVRQKKTHITIMEEIPHFGNGERVEVQLRNGYVLGLSVTSSPSCSLDASFYFTINPWLRLLSKSFVQFVHCLFLHRWQHICICVHCLLIWLCPGNPCTTLGCTP
jgi:hypothetical protein